MQAAGSSAATAVGSSAATAAAVPAPVPDIVIHQHFETVVREPSVAFMLDVSGPAYGTVNRNARGDATDVSGFNLTCGYSWKRYISRVSNPVSVYRTLGTIGGIIPHFEFGVDYKHQLCVALFWLAAGLPPLPPCLFPPPPHCPRKITPLPLALRLRTPAYPQDPRARTEAVIGLGLSYGLAPKVHAGFFS
jgi:hypothetical protein